MSFELIYNFVAARIVAYGPGLMPYISDKISLKGYITGAELVNSLISQCSWFIHVMPAIATLKANARRVTDLAKAIENVQRPRGLLQPDRPFRFPLRQPERGIRPDHPESRTDASGRRRRALPDGAAICASGAANGRSCKGDRAAARPR